MLKPIILAGGLVVAAECFVSPTLPSNLASVRRTTASNSLKMVQTQGKSWQSIAETLGNPFVPPQDKPALLQELLGEEMRSEIVSSITKVETPIDTNPRV